MTPKTRQVLLMKANGMQSKQIAFDLDIHVRTIEHHLKLARTELCAKTTCHAVAKAIKSGVISAGEIGMVIILSWSCFTNAPNVDLRRGPSVSVSRTVRRETVV